MESQIPKTVLPFILILCFVFQATTHKDLPFNSSECEAFGIKHIIISWIPTEQGNYSIYFCHQPSPCQNLSHFKFGCKSSSASRPGHRQHCDLGAAAAFDFPEPFSYTIRTDIGNLTYTTRPLRCPLSMIIKCNRMTGLRLVPIQEKVLELSWEQPTMGSLSNQLCYRIYYAPDQEGAKNRTLTRLIEDSYSHTFSPTLLPYTKYKVYIQCALSCTGGWGQIAGPVTAVTPEEAPDRPLLFSEAPDENVVNKDERNVTVTIKYPLKASWNGKVQRVTLYYQMDAANHTSNTAAKHVRSQVPLNRRQPVVLSYLRRDERYIVTAEFCTHAGCSPPSSRLIILAEDQVEFAPGQDTTSLWHALWVCLGIVGITIVVVLCIHRKLKRSSEQVPLEERLRNLDVPLVRAESPSDSHAEYDNLDSSNAREGSITQSIRTYDASSLASQRTEDFLGSECCDFSTASVRTLRSLNSLPCMTSSETLDMDLNVITEEEVQVSTQEVPHDNVINLKNAVELTLHRTTDVSGPSELTRVVTV